MIMTLNIHICVIQILHRIFLLTDIIYYVYPLRNLMYSASPSIVELVSDEIG